MLPARFTRSLHAPAALLLAVVTSGCLPSCQRRVDKALLPADSTSRALASTFVADTLDALWTKGADAERALDLSFPRTVRFSTTGDTLWVADAQRARLLAFDGSGALLDTVSGGFSNPFLAGFRGDTLVVFSAGANRFDLVAGGRVVRRVPVPGLPEERSLVRYGHAFAGGFALKAGGRKTAPFLLVLDANGRETRRVGLPGKLWRQAGLLRTPHSSGWADTLYSLVGFAPIVDRYTAGGAPGALRLDSVPLVGFDSPVLDQRRRYLVGDADAPVLTTTAAPMPGGRLFVSNTRPGWLALDVYDAGRLTHRVLSARESLNLDFLVEDLDVRALPAGTQGGAGYLVATVQAKPRPRLTLYRWRTPAAVPPSIVPPAR